MAVMVFLIPESPGWLVRKVTLFHFPTLWCVGPVQPGGQGAGVAEARGGGVRDGGGGGAEGSDRQGVRGRGGRPGMLLQGEANPSHNLLQVVFAPTNTCHRGVLIPVFIMVFLFAIQNWSGFIVVIFFAANIFKVCQISLTATNPCLRRRTPASMSSTPP